MKIRVLSVRLCLTLLLPALALVSACNKSSSDDDSGSTYTPVLKANPVVANVTATTADISATVTNFLSNTVSSYGVCWSATNQKPTVADSKTSLTTANAIFYGSSLTELTANTTYYVRAYAQHTSGTYYSDVLQFKTRTNTGSTVGVLTTFVGSTTAGFTNGTGGAAAFYSPQGVAADAAGNIYVTDAFNNSIRKITAAGVVTTLAGTNTAGYTDATGSAARFFGPSGIAVDAAGNVYVADQGNNAIRKITAAGVVTTLAGGTVGFTNATGTAARFYGPTGLTVDASGNVYVADKGNNVIRKVTSAGVVTTLSGLGTAGYVDGDITLVKFKAPTGLVFDGKGNLYVTDTGNSSIRKVVIADGSATTLIGNPSQTALLGQPQHIALDATGNFFITDANGRLLEITTGNILLSLAGGTGVVGFANGEGAAAKFSGPAGVATDAAGNVYVADIENNQIRKATVKVYN